MTEINLEHIKNSLAQITHFPWYWQENENVWQLFGGQEGHMQILKAPKHGTDYAEYWPNTHDSYVISNAPEWISSLLTTIESQKEEIEMQKARATEFLNSKIDTANAKHMLDTKNMQLQIEIESLKAITELAVKGLAMELNLAIATQNRYGITRLDTTLSEIEKLQK